jgi:hypothetical protein
MLHEFLSANRQELIRRCVSKAVKRDSPRVIPLVTALWQDQGVPLFLTQVVEMLRGEEANPASTENSASSMATMAVGSRSAALHGKQLLEHGYTIEQVVHSYGDVCQAITELALESAAPVTVNEFHTLNRLLDNAIADAVSSFAQYGDSLSAQSAQNLHELIGAVAEQQRVLLDTALRALDAIKVGNIGVVGATGALLEDSLMKLRDHIDRSLPEIRLSTGMTATLKP